MTDIRIPFVRSPERVFLADPAAIVAAAEQEQRQALEAQQLQQLLGGLHQAVSELQTSRRQSLRELQEVAVELASAAAAWLTMAAIDRNQFNLDQLIAQSIDQLGGSAPLTVRLNPQDLEMFTQLQQSDTSTLQFPDDVQFVSDPGLARGSCTAESQHISLVSDLETRLASVRQAWLENLDDAQTERRAAHRDGWEPGRVPDRRETA